MDPSSEYSLPPFSKGGAIENYLAYEDYGSWCVKRGDSSAKLVQMGLESEWQKVEHPTNCEELGRTSCEKSDSCLQLRGPHFVIDGHTTLKSNSSYDRYMAQLASCSADSVVYYQDATCSSSAHVYDATNINNSSAGMSRNQYSTTQHGNLQQVNENYVDYILEKDKGNGFNQYSEGREGYRKGNLEGNMKGSYKTGGSSLMAACSILGNQATTGNTKGIKQLNTTNSPTTMARPGNSMQISSQTPDQPNCAVDSPCWKGSLLSPKLSFGGVEILDPHPVVKVSKDGDDLVPRKNHLQASVDYVRSLPSLGRGDLTFNENIRSSCTRDFSPNNILHGTDQKFQNTNGLDCEEIGTKRSQISYGEGSKKVAKILDKSGYLSRNVKQSGEGEIFVPSAGTIQVSEAGYLETGPVDRIQEMPSDLYPDNRDPVMNLSVPVTIHDKVLKLIGSSKPARKCTARKDVELLIKAMHSLSEVLLNSYSDVDEPKGVEHELVQSVIDNLEAFTCGSKKGFTNRSSYFPGHGNHHSRVPVVETIDATKDQSNIESTMHKEKSRTSGSCKDYKKFDKSETVGDDTNFERTDNMAQSFEEDLEENVIEDSENPQVMLYKKLWIQAEAALCSMKYEFQLTRMKLEMENSKHKTKAKEAIHDALNCNAEEKLSHDTTTHVEGNGGKIGSGIPKEAKACEGHDVDASIMARLKVLKGRYGSMEEQPRSSECTVGTIGPQGPLGLADLGFVETDSTIIPER